ncbi:MAG: RNA 2',3'-cyclic phosphodiesterase [Candidatus Omnitrophota bacterium]
MRAFIAIEITAEIKGFLAGLQKELRKSNADISWVKPNNIHITMRFLGEIQPAQQNILAEILDTALRRHSPFKLRVSSLGAFPNTKSPRVIWTGIDLGTEQLQKISGELEAAIHTAGFPGEERPFTAHLTLGRTKSSLNRSLLAKIIGDLNQRFEEEKPEMTVSKVTLFKSTLTPGGPVYEALHIANLATT